MNPLPIFTSPDDKAKLISSKGESSFLFSYNPFDFEQMTISQKRGIYKELSSTLSSLEESDYLKIYSIEDKIFINTSKQDLSFDKSRVSKVDISEHLSRVFSSVDIKDDYFLFNNQFYRLLSSRQFPSDIAPNELLGVGSFILTIRRYSTQKAKRKLNFRRKIHFSSLFNGIRNLESENAYSESEELLEEITSGGESLYEVELFFLINSDTKKSLDDRTKELIQKVSNMEGRLNVESSGLSFFLYSLMPGINPIQKRSHLTQGNYLRFMLPYHRDYLMESGIRFRSRSGKSVYFSLFNEFAHNYNVLITGSSGQGKSTLANKLVYEEIREGRAAVVLDLGNSFSKNSQYLGGASFSEKINPLQFKDPTYLKEFIKSVIEVPLTPLEEGKLFKEISEFEFKEESTFRELIDYLEGSFKDIELYFSELWKYFSDSNTPVSKITYCDFSNYPNKIKAPLIIFLIEYFKSLEGKKIFVFDECWHLLGKNASYIAESFRTFRKHQASAIAISQNVDDFSNSELGSVILQNSFYRFYFQQQITNSTYASKRIQEKISDLYSVKRRYSEFLVCYDQTNKVVRYHPTPFEYELFTSAREDIISFDKYIEEKGKFFKFKESIENFVLTKYPYLGRDAYGS